MLSCKLLSCISFVCLKFLICYVHIYISWKKKMEKKFTSQKVGYLLTKPWRFGHCYREKKNIFVCDTSTFNFLRNIHIHDCFEGFFEEQPVNVTTRGHSFLCRWHQTQGFPLHPFICGDPPKYHCLPHIDFLFLELCATFSLSETHWKQTLLCLLFFQPTLGETGCVPMNVSPTKSYSSLENILFFNLKKL